MNDFSHVLPPSTIRDNVNRWLNDDIPTFDIGGFVVGDKIEVAHLFCKSSCVVCGIPFAQMVFEILNCEVEWLIEEGQIVSLEKDSKLLIAKVKGACRNILLGERTALNIMSRASGVASKAKSARDIVISYNWHGEVAGTRKVTPGFRIVEKYALVVGGVSTHRHDLSQMIMLKDNHIWSTGSITAAVKKARVAGGFSTKIEVECQNSIEALEAAIAGADIVMLDNLSPTKLLEEAAIVKAAYPHVLIEASGGITIETMHEYFSPHVDIISQGALTQGYSCCDFSLKIQK